MAEKQKRLVTFTVDLECYEETIKSAATLYQLKRMSGGLGDLTPIEKLGVQVARKFMNKEFILEGKNEC